MPVAVVVRRVGIQVPRAVPVAVAVNLAVGRPAAISATGRSPPVAGPFCAIARELPPASNTVATMRLLRMVTGWDRTSYSALMFAARITLPHFSV
jgi:hypothetical protein